MSTIRNKLLSFLLLLLSYIVPVSKPVSKLSCFMKPVQVEIYQQTLQETDMSVHNNQFWLNFYDCCFLVSIKFLKNGRVEMF